MLLVVVQERPLLLQCTVDYTVSTVIIRCSGSVVGHTEGKAMLLWVDVECL